MNDHSLTHLLEESTQLSLQFDKRNGLLPVVVQDKQTLQVLMLGYANKAALFHSLETRYATFWSTSRKKLWVKGETSGDRLRIIDIKVDCDQDALLYIVNLEGEGVCHTKNSLGKSRYSCFYRKISFADHSLSSDSPPL